MKSILKATELILKTYLREPMILLWNLAFPFFVFYVSTGKNLLNKDVGESLYFILPYLAWCVYSNSMGVFIISFGGEILDS